MFKVGSIFWALSLDKSDFDKGLKDSEKSAKKSGATWAAAVASSKKFGVGLLAVGAIATKLAVMPGLDRVLRIDQAEGKLRGLGHTQKGIAKIMKSANESVIGTFYSLDEAVSTAASAVAAGVKPGQELSKYLKATADAAAIAGVSMADMGAIMNKVKTAGRAYTLEINQLADRGIPIWQWLQKEYKTSAEGLRKMVSDGKVDAATFQRVIEENIGGAAVKMGDTVNGAWANTKTAMARLGAELWKPLVPHIKKSLDKIREFVTDLGKEINEAGGPLDWLKKKFKDNKQAVTVLTFAITFALIPAFVALGISIWTALAPLLPFLAVGAAIGWVVNWLVELFGGWSVVLDALKTVWQWLIDKWNEFYPKLKEGATIVKDALTPAWEFLVRVWKEDLLPALKDLWKTIQEDVVPALQEWWPIIKMVGIAIAVILIGAIIILILIIAALAIGISKLIGWLSKLWQFFAPMSQMLAIIIKGIPDAVKAAWEWLQRFLAIIGNVLYTTLVKPFEKAWETIKKIGLGIKNVFTDLFNFDKRHSPSINDYIRWGTEGAISAYENMFESIGAMAVDSRYLMGDAASAFDPALPGVSGGTYNFYTNVDTKYPPTKQQAREIALDVGQTLKDEIIAKGEDPGPLGYIEGETNG